MIIGLMSLKNQLVYIQFHPLTYIVKLNIEMTMASLITKLSRGVPKDATPDQVRFISITGSLDAHATSISQGGSQGDSKNSTSTGNDLVAIDFAERVQVKGIHTQTDIDITVEEYKPSDSNPDLQSDRHAS